MLEHFHFVPGRLRIRTPLFRRNRFMAAEARAQLTALDGVTYVDVNTATGSLVVRFDELQIDLEAIWQELNRGGYVPRDYRTAGTTEVQTSQAETRLVEVLSSAVVNLLAERSAAALVRAIL